MTTPIVTELPRRLEPVTDDPFIEGLVAAAAGTGSSEVWYADCVDAAEVLVTTVAPSRSGGAP
jgi:hypothetical protein